MKHLIMCTVLRDRTNKGLTYFYTRRSDQHYICGSSVGAHEFPSAEDAQQEIVRLKQSAIFHGLELEVRSFVGK